MGGSVMNILLIDDDPLVRALVKVVLEEDEDIRVFIASRGEEGLQVLDKVKPDAVLIDHSLPDGKGFEFIKRYTLDASTNDEHPRFIYFTSHSREGELSERQLKNTLGLIPKPFNPDTLSTQIRSMISKAS